MKTGNNTVVITGADLQPGHEYCVVVQAISSQGLIQSPDDSPRNFITIRGKEIPPSQPSGLTALGGIVKISLFWDVQTNKDFDVMEIWALATDNLALAVKIAETKTTTFTDNIGYTGQTRYYWIRARNTSGKTSLFYPEVNGINATTTGVAATDISDFAVTATKIFTNTVILTGDVWTNNNPGAGSIAWNTHNLVYEGKYYKVTGSNTNLRYVYWTKGHTTGTGTVADPYITTYNKTSIYAYASATFVIATNEAGVAQLVWNSSANMVVGSAFIMDLAVIDAKIDTMTVAKLTAGTLTSKIITLAAAGAGDCFIASGKTDFTNTETGFILGVDDSDGDKPKFYIGSSTKYLNWDGTALTIRGTLNATDITAGTLTAIPLTTGSGARITIDPSANIGLEVVDTTGGSPLQCWIAGAGDPGVGDILIGDYAGGKGLKWDYSAGTFTVRGSLNADDVSAGTLTGRVVRTDTGGVGHYKRIELDVSDNTLRFYNATNVNVLTVDDDIAGSGYPGIKMDSISGGMVYLYKSATDRTTISDGQITVAIDGNSVIPIQAIQNSSSCTVIQATINSTYTGKLFRGYANSVEVFTVIETGKIYGKGGLDVDNQIYVKHYNIKFADVNGNTPSYLRWYSADTLEILNSLKVYADMDCEHGVYRVAGTQVVGAQGAAVADATDAASVILRLNDLLARCRTHGLIAT